EAALTQYFLEKLKDVTSYSQFLETPLRLDPDDFVPAATRKRWLALPDTVVLQGAEHPLDYAMEDGEAIVRARIPEKVLWQLRAADVPALDRPLHWTVRRGKKGAVRAATLDEARELASLSKAQLRARSSEERDSSTGSEGHRSTGAARAGAEEKRRPRRGKASAGSEDSTERPGPRGRGRKPPAQDRSGRGRPRGGRRRG